MSGSVRRSLGATLVALGLLGAVAVPPAAAVGGKPFTLELSGAEEAPGPGDPDGSGIAMLRLKTAGEVCYSITVSNLDPVVGAHIHIAPAGSPGPVVVPLPIGATGGEGCVEADKELIKAIKSDPSEYYVNVHTTVYPAGAVRSQLG